jgi:hypothetical protein
MNIIYCINISLVLLFVILSIIKEGKIIFKYPDNVVFFILYIFL